MQTTTNLGLKKPQLSDLINIDDLNYNADILDAEIKALQGIANDIELTAEKVSIKDVQDFYTSTNVEGALSEIKDKLISIGDAKNKFYSVVVNPASWVEEGELFACTIAHNLEVDRLIVTALDTTTLENIFLAYKVESNSRIKIFSEVRASIEVFMYGNIESEQIQPHINDTTNSTLSTWSSSKIISELSGKSNTGHTHSMSEITGLELSSTKVNRPNAKTVEESLVANETSILSLQNQLGQNITLMQDDISTIRGVL